jgi:hypothetical protein
MCRPPFTPRKIPGTHFCYRLSQNQGLSVAGRIRSTEKSNDLFGNQNRDLLAGSAMPQSCYHMALCEKLKSNKEFDITKKKKARRQMNEGINTTCDTSTKVHTVLINAVMNHRVKTDNIFGNNKEVLGVIS